MLAGWDRTNNITSVSTRIVFTSLAEPRVLFARGAALRPGLRHARPTAASLPACRCYGSSAARLQARPSQILPLGQDVATGHQGGTSRRSPAACRASSWPSGSHPHLPMQTVLANNSEHSAALRVPKCSCTQSYSSLQVDGLLPALPLRPSAPQEAQEQTRNPTWRCCSDFPWHKPVFQKEMKPPRTPAKLPSTHAEVHQCTSGSMKKHSGCRRAFLRQPPCSPGIGQLGLRTPSSTSSEPSLHSFSRRKGAGEPSLPSGQHFVFPKSSKEMDCCAVGALLTLWYLGCACTFISYSFHPPPSPPQHSVVSNAH